MSSDIGGMCDFWTISIRLEAKLRPNIGFTLRGDLAVFTRSAITPPKVNRFGWNLEHAGVHCWGLALADFGRDPRSSDSLRGRRIFCQVNNARFPVGQISRNLDTTTLIGVAMKTFEQNFESFTVMGRFSKKNAKNLTQFQRHAT